MKNTDDHDLNQIHTCSYQCERPACIRAQRDELVARFESQAQAVVVPDSVIVLLNHLETLMDEGKLEEDAIPTDMWNAVSMHNFALAQQRAAEALACACRLPTCGESWEPGCGLGNSEQHTEAQGQDGVVVVCDCGATPENRWPHHDECSIYTAPPSAPVGLRATQEDRGEFYSDTAAKDAEIEALRVEAERWMAGCRQWEEISNGWHTRYFEQHDRAERLAEALREVEHQCKAHERHRRLTDYWRPAFVAIRHIAERALHPTAAQEDGND